MLALRHSRKEVLHASRRERAFACTVLECTACEPVAARRPTVRYCVLSSQAGGGPQKGFHTTDECRNATRTLQRTRARVLSAEWSRQMPLCAVAIANVRTYRAVTHACMCMRVRRLCACARVTECAWECKQVTECAWECKQEDHSGAVEGQSLAHGAQSARIVSSRS
jgi:hypothetical protein